MKTTPKNEEKLQTENDPNNEDNLKYEDYLKYEDNLKYQAFQLNFQQGGWRLMGGNQSGMVGNAPWFHHDNSIKYHGYLKTDSKYI